MSVTQKRSAIILSEEQTQALQRIQSSKNGSRSAIIRAGVLLRYTRGEAIKAIARKEGITRPTVQLCIDKALSGGIETAIQDLPRPGRPPVVTTEDKAWVMQLACSKPAEHGYPSEVWTLSRLTAHVRKYARETGHVSLDRATKYLIRRIIKESPDSPHNVAYYFDSQTAETGEGTASILTVIRDIDLFCETGVVIPANQEGSEDLKVQKSATKAGIEITADLASEPNSHPLWFQNNDHARVGAVTLMAGIDLTDGRVVALVQKKGQTDRFVEFLKVVDGRYPSNWRIRIVTGNCLTAASRNNMKALKHYPNRFEFDDVRADGSWLSLLEVFFTGMIRSFLCTISVKSRAEFINRMNQYLEEINLFTVVER